MRRASWTTGLLCALLVGAPAAAVEPLTGVYAAKVSCKVIQQGVRGKQRGEFDVALLDQGGGQVVFHVEGLGDFAGFLITDLAKPNGGVLSGVGCPVSAANQDGGILQADVKTKSGSEAASFKGTLIILDQGEQQSAVCKISGKRFSTSSPKLVGCPD